MKKIRWIFSIGAIALLTFYAGCSKNDPAPATADGKWTYTTVDGKMKVTFELVKNSAGSVDIKPDATMVVNGTSGNAAAQMSGVNLPTIGSIVINANDAALVYPYTITFTSIKFLSDQNRLDVSSGSYTYPNGVSNTFASISITRP